MGLTAAKIFDGSESPGVRFPRPAQSSARPDPSRQMPGEDSEIIGRSEPVIRLFKLIELVGSKNVTVLITGETGTGKELVARSIHAKSQRRNAAFAALNCGAIPENLLEDELFGHAAGAFTGASRERIGRLEQANGGTIFLDEIGEMAPLLQSKLLRVLETRQLERLGSNKTRPLDIRVVAATNCDLREKIRKGEFREDLFYRINVAPLQLPALRERREDIPLLATHFLRSFSQEHRLLSKHIEPRTLNRLIQHEWPGNIRQLRNALEYAALTSGERQMLTIDDFPHSGLVDRNSLGGRLQANAFTLPDDGVDLDELVHDVERYFIEQSLQRTGGNKSKAARLLSLNRSTLSAKIRRLEEM